MNVSKWSTSIRTLKCITNLQFRSKFSIKSHQNKFSTFRKDSSGIVRWKLFNLSLIHSNDNPFHPFENLQQFKLSSINHYIPSTNFLSNIRNFSSVYWSTKKYLSVIISIRLESTLQMQTSENHRFPSEFIWFSLLIWNFSSLPFEVVNWGKTSPLLLHCRNSCDLDYYVDRF